MKRLPQFLAAAVAVLALAAALFAVPADEARAHSATNHPGLPFAARDGNWEDVLHYMNQHDLAALNVQHSTGETPLNYAVQSNRVTIALTLIALGVDVDLANIDNITPLHNAARHGNLLIASALISAGASLNVRVKTGATPLVWAGAHGKIAIFPLLIGAGAHWGEPCAEGEMVSTIPNAAAGEDPYPPSPACIPDPEAKCPDGHVRRDEAGACDADPVLMAANAALRAEIGKNKPDYVAVRRALDGGASPNITTSAGIPILVDAALGLHAKVVSVLITAGADPLVKVAGIHDNTHNPQALSAFIPGALAERVFRDRNKAAKEFPIGEKWAETIIHFGDAAGDKFPWEILDRTGPNRFNEEIFTFTAGELVLGFLQMTRALHRRNQNSSEKQSEEQFSNAIGRYVRVRGESCVDGWYGYQRNAVRDRERFIPLCDDRIACSSATSGEAYSCLRGCDGLPLRARKPADGYEGTCVFACGENEHVVAGWPDSKCQCEHGAADAQGNCPVLPIEQTLLKEALLNEALEESPNIATIRALLSRGASVTLTLANLTLDDGRPLIFAALSLRHADVISVLVTAGARPDVRHNFADNGFPDIYSVPERILRNARVELAAGGGGVHERGDGATDDSFRRGGEDCGGRLQRQFPMGERRIVHLPPGGV